MFQQHCLIESLKTIKQPDAKCLFRRFDVTEVLEALDRITHVPTSQGQSQSFHFTTQTMGDSENKF